MLVVMGENMNVDLVMPSQHVSGYQALMDDVLGIRRMLILIQANFMAQATDL